MLMVFCFDNGCCFWLSCSLVEVGLVGEVFFLNGIFVVSVYGNSKLLQFDEDVICLFQVDVLVGIKGVIFVYLKFKRLNRFVVCVFVLLNCKFLSCVLGMGMVIFDCVFLMFDFVRDILYGFGENDIFVVREFSVCVCKFIIIYFLVSL